MGVSSAGGREGPGAGEVRGLVCSGSERSGNDSTKHSWMLHQRLEQNVRATR